MSNHLEPRLIVFTGPMFSAKTMHLIAHFKMLEVGGYNPLAFRPVKDTRDQEPVIRTRFGDVSIPAITIGESQEITEHLPEESCPVFIDEAQFFDDDLPQVVSELLYQMPVFVSGLDLDFLGRPFGPIPHLMAIAQEVHKYTAVCGRCGSQLASRSQRLRDGKPSNSNEPEVLPEGKEPNVTYEPRCLKCYVR